MACEFDAMGALSTHYNDTPEKASRTYDNERDGFVIAGGGGMVVVEELEHALARGAQSMPKSSVMVPLQMALTWLPRLAKAQSAACTWRCRALTPRLIT
jgi:hypothetical protein